MNAPGGMGRLLLAGGMILAAVAAAPAQEASAAPWSLGLGGGYIRFEGDEATKSGGAVLLRLGYDPAPRWTVRGEFAFYPELKSNAVFNYEHGVPEPRPGLHTDSTWAAGLSGDALFHFNAAADRRWDPYLVGGLGLLYYDQEREGRARVDVPVRAGLGLAFQCTPAWSVWAEALGQVTLDKTEFNLIPAAGVSWRWGAPAARAATAWTAAPGSAEAPGLAAAPGAAATPELAPLVAPDLRLEFDTDQAVIRPAYFDELDKLGRELQRKAGLKARIEGHADRRRTSSAAYNQKLSERRAAAVSDYLQRKHGLDAGRLPSKGFGFTRPAELNDPVQGHQRNRRVEVFLEQ